MGALKAAAIFTDHMVVQMGKPIILWGTGYACGNGCTFAVNGDAAKYVGCSVCLHLLSVDVRQN